VLNSQKRHLLGSKNVCELQEQLLGVLPVTKELLIENSNRYICDISCVKDVRKYYKLKANVDTLKSSLIQRFKQGVQQREKQGLPSDVELYQSPVSKQAVTSDSQLQTTGHSHRKLQFNGCSNIINNERECEQNPLKTHATQPFYSAFPPIAPWSPSSLCVDYNIEATGLLPNDDTSQILVEKCKSVEVIL
jgi:hypothetical protein